MLIYVCIYVCTIVRMYVHMMSYVLTCVCLLSISFSGSVVWAVDDQSFWWWSCFVRYIWASLRIFLEEALCKCELSNFTVTNSMIGKLFLCSAAETSAFRRMRWMCWISKSVSCCAIPNTEHTSRRWTRRSRLSSTRANGPTWYQHSESSTRYSRWPCCADLEFVRCLFFWCSPNDVICECGFA